MLDELRQFVEVVLLAVAALLPIVDPLGGAPIYLVLTRGVGHGERAQLAKLVAFDSFLLLLAAALFGTYVLDFFGVSIPDVQIAGGIVVCALGWSLLNKQDTPEAQARTAAAAQQRAEIGGKDIVASMRPRRRLTGSLLHPREVHDASSGRVQIIAPDE